MIINKNIYQIVYKFNKANIKISTNNLCIYNNNDNNCRKIHIINHWDIIKINN
jgi:hypothetical protein